MVALDPGTGELFAVSGDGRDARVLGDGLWLGPAWHELLGESPRPALGCLEGRCVFHEVRVQGLELPTGFSPPPFPAENLAPEPAPPVKPKAVAARPREPAKPKEAAKPKPAPAPKPTGKEKRGR